MRKKRENYFNLEIPSDSANERFARQCVAAFVSTLDPTLSELADLRTAVSEAVTNCIVHAYRGRLGKIYISVEVSSSRRVVVRVRDCGCGMEDIELCRQPLYTSDPEGERGGMGFAIMESFCDRVRIKSQVGRGTTVTLIKTFTKENDPV